MFRTIFAAVVILVVIALCAVYAGNNLSRVRSNSPTSGQSATRLITCPTRRSEKPMGRSLISATSSSENPYTIRFEINPSHEDKVNDLMANEVLVDFGDGTCGRPYLLPHNCGADNRHCFGGAVIGRTYSAAGAYTARLLVPASVCDPQNRESCLWETIESTTINIKRNGSPTPDK
jgi:hypothetical protein